ncbi:hypothetical protein LSH36_748g02080 [Paralvinella palmiformis]|uniref:Serine/threonine-protein kinase ATR n=1 Tax=Paralvinella palmiformis TaxID=53620 RepID=A0AAD9MUQ7_9ANNE|nr:hypothetical protein LSH36_748g02080 [Paralvinella palmiformis]
MDQLIQQVKRIISGSVESETQSPDDWRDLILQIFANVHKHKSVLELVFEMLNFLLTNNPELFVLFDPDGFSDVTEEEQKCYGLTTGLLRHLLMLLSNPGTPAVYGNTAMFISRLLVLLKSRDPAFFRKVASDLVFCLSDLVRIERDIYSSGSPGDPEIKRFCLCEGKHKSGPILKQLLILDLSSCNQLQVSITRVLMTIVPELCLYIPDVTQQVNLSMPSTLWASLSYQLEYGPLELKTVSVELMTKLLSIGGLPEPVILDYYLDCLVALMDASCSGIVSCHGDSAPLENVLAENLPVLLSACQQAEVMEQDAEQIYEELSLGLCQCIINNGFSKLQTTGLKYAICDLLRDTSNLLAERHYKNSILFDQIRRAAEFIIQNIGSSADFSYVVGFVSASLHHDIRNNMKLWCSTRGSGSGMTENRRGHENATHKKNESPTKKTPVEDLESSFIYTSLMSKLDELCEMLVHSKIKEYSILLEGVWLILEILAWARIALFEDEPARKRKVELNLLNDKEGEVINVWRKLLHQLVHKEREDASKLYHHTVSGIGTLLQLTDISKSEPNTQQFVVWMLSLPWLSGEVSWKDLKPPEIREINELLAKIGDLAYPNTQAICISLLASLPKEVIPMWRTRVIQLALASMEEEVRSVAVKSFPVYVHQSGPSVHHLVKECIHPLLKDPSVAVQQAMAKSVGVLACVMSRKSVLSRSSKTLSSERHAYNVIRVHCIVCEKIAADHLEKAKKEPQNCLEIVTFLPFVEAAINPPAAMNSIKIDIIRSVPQMLSHIMFRGCNPQAINFINICLQLMKDEDYAVRFEFSKVAQHFVCILGGDGRAEILQNFVSTISKIVNVCRASEHLHVLETVLLTIGQVAKASQDDLLLSMLVILLDHICRKPSQLAWAIACSQVKEIASYKKQEETYFIMQHGRTLLKVLVDHLHDAGSGKLDRDPAVIVADVATAFGFSDANGFLRRSEYMLLPHIVKKATSTASALLRLVGKQLNNSNHRTALNENMRHIFCHLVCSCESEELRRTLTFLENEMNWKLGDILKAQSNINFELLLHLASDPNRVLMGLKILIARSESCQDVTNNMVVESLQPCLLGILVHFDNYLNNGTNPVKEKQKAYRSLVPLMKLMGTEHITKVRVRLMTTLKIGLNFNDLVFAELCCTAWSCFVHMLDLTVAGSMLSQIIVNLLPLIQTVPHMAVPIVEYLVVENKQILHEHFHELYFLPDNEELAHVNAILKPSTEGSGHQSEAFSTHIQHLLKGVTHESVDVRQLALSKLKTLLRSNQSSLQHLVLSSETGDPIVSQIITKLLQGCRESDQTMRVLYAECLGELGAIDPGRLGLAKSEPKRELAHFNATITEENFAFGLINELGKAFLRADNRRTQDCVAFAIQELIQFFAITRSPESSTAGGVLWRRFKDEVQEILTPLFESKYTITMAYDWSKQTKPIYHSKKCKNFEKWISTLTGYLASKVRSEKPLRVLDACRGVIRFVSQISLFLLPYVVIHVLLEGRPDDQEDLVGEILAVLHNVKNPDTRHGSASDLRHMSAQTVFNILDHVTTWSRHRLMLISRMASQSKGRGGAGGGAEALTSDLGYQYVQRFLDRIPQDLLAHASYNCGAFSRALMHFEQHLKTTDSAVVHTQQSYDFLQQLYIALHEPDGVAGVTAIKQSAPTLGEQIKAYESMGQLADASVCYDKAIQLEPDNISYRQGLICCRLALGELQSALAFTNGIIAERPAWSSQLNGYRVEAAWKLGQWDRLDVYLRLEEKSRDWNVGLGKILMAAKNRNESDVRNQLHVLRCQQMAPLSAACMEVGSYQRGYEYIVRLHILNEVEMGMSALFNFDLTREVTSSGTERRAEPIERSSLFSQWRNRLHFMQASYQKQEPILNVRRIMLSLAKQDYGHDVDTEIGQTWLQMAKAARESGFIQTAHSSLLSASGYQLPEYCLENAQWFWDRAEYDKAQACLEQAIDNSYADRFTWMAEGDRGVSAERRLACARILLLLGRYREETASCESNAIMRQYRDVQQVHSEWEDGYFYTGKYYDKIMVQLIETEKPEKKGEFILKVVGSFGKSLKYGSQYIYQSMPRMLTLWLDYGSEVVDLGKRIAPRNDVQLQSMRAVVQSLNRLMAEFRANLAPYQFLTAFPQLISRICHPDPDVFGELKDIIAKLLVQFRQQAIWMMMAVSKSSYQMRVRRCADIFSKAKSMDRDLAKFLHDATKLTDRLLDLCNRNVETGSYTLSIGQHFKPLQRLINDDKFSLILLPLQTQMTPLLPSSSVSPNSHNCVSGAQVYITGIEDAVEVLPSLQRPKKITFQGSDGHLYIMLCKPKDDLRKDGRLMEFNGIINKCLHKDPESRRRDLHIRTYTVTPLNEECGLLEWVPNTSGLRNILMRLYKERGLYMSGKELKSLQLPPNAPLESKRKVYTEKLLPRHPAIFSEWFLKTFPDPTSWYNARLAYTRTVAVMSVVGYVLGLGDRHGENILFDSTSGDCVHVDFNCLFNKGETFDFPEIVPFRLTHNMVEAMGPTGREGLFRRASEVTLRVMRDQMDPLMSVLSTFIYDPLVEWSKPARGKTTASDTGETRNEKAQTHIVNIESRLKGVLKNKTKPRGLPLSVEGQVNHLIKEATDVNNLCQMYIGWAAYM